MTVPDRNAVPEQLAMTSIPKQEWHEPYDLCTSLMEGTIFPDLNMTFFKAPEGACAENSKDCSENDNQKTRETMLSKLTKISFALNDLTLYLDTHPACEHGLSMFHDLMEKRLSLLADFAREFYPLTQASMITGGCSPNVFDWGEGPAPWEGACI